METLTPTLNSIVTDSEMSQNTFNMIAVEDLEFYETLKPALNQIILNPSDAVVDCILAFSKSF